jgi:hypothetical protein
MSKPNKHHELIYTDILNARICSEGTWDEALEWLRLTNPAGTSNNWKKKDDLPQALPVACANNSGRTHYMFVC